MITEVIYHCLICNDDYYGICREHGYIEVAVAPLCTIEGIS